MTVRTFLSIEDSARYLGCSRRHIERERAAGRFPKPDFMIGNRPRWKMETILDLIEGVEPANARNNIG